MSWEQSVPRESELAPDTSADAVAAAGVVVVIVEEVAALLLSLIGWEIDGTVGWPVESTDEVEELDAVEDEVVVLLGGCCFFFKWSL